MDDIDTPNESASEQPKENWFEQGQAHHDAQRYEEALAAFEQVLQRESTNARPWKWKGSTLAHLQRYEEALAAFEHALQHNPTDAYAWQQQGIVLVHLRRYEKALEMYEQALVLDPSDPHTWTGKATVLYYLQRPQEALTAYEQALALEPQDVSAWIGKSGALSRLQRYEEALTAVEHALQLDPTHTHAWNWKGSALCDLQRNEEALAAYDQALALDPTYTNAWKMKGISLSELQREEEALAAFEQALTLDSKILRAWEGKISALYRLQRYEEALGACEAILQLDPRNAFAWQEMGHAYAHLQRYQEALPAYEHVLALDPTYGVAWLDKGTILFHLGRREEALAAFDQALELDQENVNVWKNRGNLLQWLQRYEEALASYERALALDPRDADARADRDLVLSHLQEQIALLAAHKQALKDGGQSARIFAGLNAIPWAELPHAYGSGEEIPVWLRQLTSADKQVRQMAMGRLGSSLEHQGSIYPATAYAVPYLIALLEEPALLGKNEILGWLAAFYRGYPLDEQMWYGEEGTESYGAWGEMPRTIPYKDTHAAIQAGIPVYVKLLEAPILIDRLEAAHLLMRFSPRTPDLWPSLQTALEREPTDAGKADLILELGRLARHLPEQIPFFLERFGTDQGELEAFATALVIARLAKEAAPEEVKHLLVRVMLEAPSSLELYRRLPCGGTYPWSAALWALANLGPARLAFLVPSLEAHLQQSRQASVVDQALFARLLLFIVFAATPQQGRPFGPAETLTVEQRQSLLVLLEHEPLWQDRPFLGLLRAYGVPGNRAQMVAYLGREAPAEAPREVSGKPPSTPKPVAEHPGMQRMERYREVLQAAFPDMDIFRLGGLGIQSEESQEEDVLEVNADLLFRFPRRAEAVEAVEREIALLRTLRDHLPLPIPNPAYSSQGTREIGRFFMGTVMLPGKPLSKGLLECMDGEVTVQHLAEQLASFLAALHQFPVAQLSPLSLPEAPNRQAVEALLLRAREELFPQMPRVRQAEIITQFEAFLERPEHFEVTPVLLHGNFGPETILYAASERRISGIIDFSRACLGDPAMDFARLVGQSGYGEVFLQRWMPLYPGLSIVLERATFYATVVALEGEWRKRRKQEQPGLRITPPPEVERLFAEAAELREVGAGEDETPIGGYFN